jgi:hypothetical protein
VLGIARKRGQLNGNSDIHLPSFEEPGRMTDCSREPLAAP